VNTYILVGFDICDMPTIIGTYSTRELAEDWEKHYSARQWENEFDARYYCIYEYPLVSSKPTEVNDGREET